MSAPLVDRFDPGQTPAKALENALRLYDKYAGRMKEPIVVKHNWDIASLSFNIDCMIGEGHATASYLRGIANVLFLMGFDAANDETPIPDAFKE